MKKKIGIIIGIFILCFSVISQVFATTKTPTIVVNGKKVAFQTSPIVKKGNILIPVRDFGNALKAKVTWNQKTKTATVSRKGHTVQMTVGKSYVKHNGKIVKMDTKVMLYKNRIYIPVKYAVATLGLQMTVDAKKNIVYCKEKVVVKPKPKPLPKPQPKPENPKPKPEPQPQNDLRKAGNVIVTNVSNVDTILKDVERFGLNTVNVPIQVDIPNRYDHHVTVNTTQKEKAISLIKELKKRNIQIVLEPFPYVENGGVGETEWNPADKKLMFEEWRTKVLDTMIKDIANPYQVDAIKVGSNFVHMENEDAEWVRTIQQVKETYKGKVMLQANWWYTATWDAPSTNHFQELIAHDYWNYVDIISVDAWFEVTEKTSPSFQEAVDAFVKTDVYSRNQNILEEMHAFHNKTGKMIYFGGFNIPARTDGLLHPWDASIGTKDDTVQYNGWKMYQHYLQNETWFEGFSIWHIGGKNEDTAYLITSPETEKLIREWKKRA